MTDDARSPVRSVRLAVFFDASDTLGPGSLDGLYHAFRPQYPEVTYSPPALGGNPGRVTDALEGKAPWPLGLTTYESKLADRKIVFQEDRFALSWEFDDNVDTIQGYPGFPALQRELLERYAEFKRIISENSEDLEIRDTAVEIVYSNEIDRKYLWTAISGVALGSDDGKDDRRAEAEKSISLTVHRHVGDTPIWVVVRAPLDGPFELRFRVKIKLHGTDTDESSRREIKLAEGHDVITGDFERFLRDQGDKT